MDTLSMDLTLSLNCLILIAYGLLLKEKNLDFFSIKCNNPSPERDSCTREAISCKSKCSPTKSSCGVILISLNGKILCCYFYRSFSFKKLLLRKIKVILFEYFSIPGVDILSPVSFLICAQTKDLSRSGQPPIPLGILRIAYQTFTVDSDDLG